MSNNLKRIKLKMMKQNNNIPDAMNCIQKLIILIKKQNNQEKTLKK